MQCVVVLKVDVIFFAVLLFWIVMIWSCYIILNFYYKVTLSGTADDMLKVFRVVGESLELF